MWNAELSNFHTNSELREKLWDLGPDEEFYVFDNRKHNPHKGKIDKSDFTKIKNVVHVKQIQI